MTSPLKIQTSDPSSVCTTFGARLAVLRRDVGVEQLGRLHEVVVDADHDHGFGSHINLLSGQ